MAAEPYFQFRRTYQNVSGNRRVLAADSATASLIVCPRVTTETIYLQKLHIEVTTSGAFTWSFKDSAGTPIDIVPAVSTAAIAHFDFDFGAEGVPMTQGKDLQLVISGAGAVGWLTWEAYAKRTVVAAA